RGGEGRGAGVPAGRRTGRSGRTARRQRWRRVPSGRHRSEARVPGDERASAISTSTNRTLPSSDIRNRSANSSGDSPTTAPERRVAGPRRALFSAALWATNPPRLVSDMTKLEPVHDAGKRLRSYSYRHKEPEACVAPVNRHYRTGKGLTFGRFG